MEKFDNQYILIKWGGVMKEKQKSIGWFIVLVLISMALLPVLLLSIINFLAQSIH